MVHEELTLTRATIKGALKSMDYSRRLQTVLANISCGTFSKYYSKEGVRLSVKCPLCSEVCALPHLQGHMSERFPRNGEEDDIINYLVRLVKKADPGSRLLPLPTQDPE